MVTLIIYITIIIAIGTISVCAWIFYQEFGVEYGKKIKANLIDQQTIYQNRIEILSQLSELNTKENLITSIEERFGKIQGLKEKTVYELQQILGIR